MTLDAYLAAAVAAGVRRIGQLAIASDNGAPPYRLCHRDDAADPDGLETVNGPSRARELSTWSDAGDYRFLKAAPNLRRGWLMRLRDARELRQALDGFHPAAVGLWRAFRQDSAEVQHLRAKLARQTGMYRSVRDISDTAARQVVAQVCDPANCAKRILWQLDEHGPLDGEPAGPADPGGDEIPLLCREPCNHLVAACRLAMKRQAEGSGNGGEGSPGADSH